MKYIAHRGMMEGPYKSLENTPNQINKAYFDGFDVEIDVWNIDGKWYTGHDSAQYYVDLPFLDRPGFWLHCKNLDALKLLTAYYFLKQLNADFFWHQTDDYTITRRGYIWTYPGKTLTGLSVCVLPEKNSNPYVFKEDCYGVCSDYVGLMNI